jgi:pyridoxine 5-phosphate synthase
MHLGVNIDHVATIRQARRGLEPRPVEAARVVEKAGAHGITVHLRLDRRHIQDHDIPEIQQASALPLNIEMACHESMLALADRFGPATVTLVPEDPREITTNGGLDARGAEGMIGRFMGLGERRNFRVSVFVDPDVEQIDALAGMGIRLIEINTAKYCETFGDAENLHELARIERATERAISAGMTVAAGHGLDTRNLPALIEIEGIEELNIGHSIVARSVFIGLEAAIGEVLDLIDPARAKKKKRKKT